MLGLYCIKNDKQYELRTWTKDIKDIYVCGGWQERLRLLIWKKKFYAFSQIQKDKGYYENKNGSTCEIYGYLMPWYRMMWKINGDIMDSLSRNAYIA